MTILPSIPHALHVLELAELCLPGGTGAKQARAGMPQLVSCSRLHATMNTVLPVPQAS